MNTSELGHVFALWVKLKTVDRKFLPFPNSNVDVCEHIIGTSKFWTQLKFEEREEVVD